MADFQITLTPVRYYTPFTPYNYGADNVPITDLDARDLQIATEVGMLVDVTGGITPVVNKLPAGWGVAKVDTGEYLITHNLALTSTSYGVIATIITASDTARPNAFVYAIGTNTFKVRICDHDGALIDDRFICQLRTYT